MPSEEHFGTTAEGTFPPCPLPLAEHLGGSGLAHCLVAARPLIQAVRERVRQHIRDLVKSHPKAPFDPANIEESLAANLVGPLLLMMTRVMVLELNVARLAGVLAGDSAKERFASYVRRLCDPVVAGKLLAEYPVLNEQIVSRLERWATFSLEFLRHICDDWDSLLPWFDETSPGTIVTVEAGAGDIHRGGRSVMIVGFSGGKCLVYKPRSLAADGHFQQLLGWLNEHGAQPNFHLLKVSDRGDHGWSEFVSAAPCASDAELYRFYQRQGSYLALLHVLQARDFYCENLIAAGEHPVLIDLEALFHPRFQDSTPQHATEIARAFLGSSVISVGLLPLHLWASEDHPGIDLSGLSNRAGQVSPDPVPQWERVDTDEMRMVRKRVELTGSDNCPTLNGQQVNALDYAQPIASGFASTYRLLLSHRAELPSLLQSFADDEVRVIVRPTKTYAVLHRESFHPDMLRNIDDRRALFDRLQETVASRPELERLVPAEICDLLRGDIPLFTTRPASRHLWTSTQERIDNHFAEAGMSLVDRCLSELSDKDLERQLWIVGASVATLATHADGPNFWTHPGSSPQTAPTSEQLISAATTVGERLAKLALGTGDEKTWIGLEIARENQWRVSPLGTDLYDGLPGVILFLAYLGAVTGDSRYDVLAKAALKTLRAQMQQLGDPKAIGAFTGWGSIIYLLTHLGVTWSDTSLLTEAENLVNSIPALVEGDQVLDMIGGAAGCVLALLALHQCKPSVRTLETLRACGEHLLLTAQPAQHGIGWRCGGKATSLLTGFAHGNAGIAYALLALAEATGENRFQQAAVDAFAYERSLYSPEHRNWPDLRNSVVGRFASAWCHGAPGIGLSRMCSLRYWKDPLIEQEIETALSTTWSEGLGNNHSLCHGDLGNGDILLHASEVLHERRWRDYADQIAASALDRANVTGWVCGNPLGVESPGFMTGLAGIGYALLRLANPRRVPSVLALEPPVSR
jgi:type 2 lantibiotic biosynthesis protein LanM